MRELEDIIRELRATRASLPSSIEWCREAAEAIARQLAQLEAARDRLAAAARRGCNLA